MKRKREQEKREGDETLLQRGRWRKRRATKGWELQ